MHLWLLVACLLISGGVYGDENDVANAVSSDEDQLQLRDYLNLGYLLSQNDITRNKKILQESSDVPVDYLVTLYNLYLEHRSVNLENVDLSNLVSNGNIICFPNGKCVTVDVQDEIEDEEYNEPELKPELRKNQICFPNGKCVDIDDPGIHPRVDMPVAP